MGSLGTPDLAAPNKPIIDEALKKAGDIATLPEVTAKIIELVEDPSSTARDMHELIKTDPSLSARVLKVVNSAFYGLPGQIASVDRAIVLLGLSAVKNIAIAASISRMFKGQQVGAGFTAKDIWKHSVAVGAAGRLLAKECGYAGAGEEVFLAGLIHDLGILVERQAFPDQLTQIVERCMTGCGDFITLEEEILGATHEEFGMAITTKWKFPKNLRAVIGMHHHPENIAPELRTFGDIIHLADILCCEQKIGFHLTAAHEEITDELLDQVGLTRAQFPGIVESLEEVVSNAEACLATD